MKVLPRWHLTVKPDDLRAAARRGLFATATRNGVAFSWWERMLPTRFLRARLYSRIQRMAVRA